MSTRQTNWIFYFGIFTLPFDNLSFAPSSGWATITPIIFFFYVIININFVKKVFEDNIWLLALLYIYLLVYAINLFFIPFNMARMIDALVSLILGVSSFIAFYIFFVLNNKKNIKMLENVLIISYAISLICGWIIYFSIQFSFNSILQISRMLQKRIYFDSGRIAFTFTEPSFIGRHLYGILLLFYAFIDSPKIRNLIIVFAISALVISGSVRFILDTAIILVVLLVSRLNLKKVRDVLLVVIVLFIASGLFSVLYKSSSRLQDIIANGIYSDISLSIRWFKINAMLKGYAKEPLRFLFGYGLGNSIVAMQNGFSEAFSEYSNPYIAKSILFLATDEALSNASVTSGNLYFVLFSDIGFIATMFFFFRLLTITIKADKKLLKYFLVTAYTYVQGGSLAFFNLWLFIVLVKYRRGANKTSLNLPESSARQ